MLSTKRSPVADEAFLPFARPSITEAEKAAVREVLDDGWITTGPRAKEFESRFAARVRARHAIALSSATAGLHLALEAVGVGPGDEVIVPTWTFAASAEVVVQLGGRPVLVDPDATTLNASPDTITAALTPRTKAVVAVHFGGLASAPDRLAEALERSGVALVEDAAHAFPSRMSDGRYAGTYGRAGVYSFYATKTITTGEGGMLVTDDDALAARARVMSLHGISANAWNRYAQAGTWYYEIEAAGYKYNMTDIAAALGLVQLERADELHEARRRLADGYGQRIGSSSIADLVELPAGTGDPSHAWHLYVIRLQLDRLAIDRSSVIDRLRERGIGTSVHFIPLHLHPYYQKTWQYGPGDLPIATREFDRVISLPLWPGMSEGQLDRVVFGLHAVLDTARR